MTNRKPARGGMDAESLENALVRGPQEIYSQHRAVTAREFEKIVLRFPYIARARAIAQADLWRHAVPGTVDIVLVPRLTKAQMINLESLQANQDLENLGRIESELKSRSPIGIRSQLRWARYKRVWVEAQIFFGSNEEVDAVQQRVTERLDRLISPLPAAQDAGGDTAQMDAAWASENAERLPAALITQAGWPFGQQLRVADVYNLILAGEQSKILITSLELHLEHAPSQEVAAMASDFFQPHTWYAGSGRRLFRSTNDGTGWELILHFDRSSTDKIFRRKKDGWELGRISPSETIRHICPSPDLPGMVALSTETVVQGALRSWLYLSLDCGEHWYYLAVLQDAGTELQPGEIEDMAWLVRADRHVLLLATDNGLLEVNLGFEADGQPEEADMFQVPVLPAQPAHPLYALAVVRSNRGGRQVVVALKGRRGVYIASGDSLASRNQFASLPMENGDRPLGEDVRRLRVQYQNERTYLWACVMALSDNGLGCYRWQIDQTGQMVESGSMWVSQGWEGGSCLGVAFDDTPASDGGQNYARVYAASAWGGLLRADLDVKNPDRPLPWRRFSSEDLPHRPIQMEGTRRDRGLYEPLVALDARQGVVMVVSTEGVYRRVQLEQDFSEERYEKISRDTFRNLRDAVTLPPDWLLISGAHSIKAQFDSGFDGDVHSLEPDVSQSGAQELALGWLDARGEFERSG